MPEKWIQHAIKHKGAATKKAAREGLPVHEWAQKHHEDQGVTGKQARLALTLHQISQHEDEGGADPEAEPEAPQPSGGMGLMR